VSLAAPRQDDDATLQLLRIDALPAGDAPTRSCAAKGSPCRRRWRRAWSSKASPSCANCR
jgi:hypothetical protein